MSTKHTPGPWRFGEAKNGYTTIGGGNWGEFATVVTRMEGRDHDDPTGVANARLIVAAPDLLAAVEALFQHCSMIHNVWGDGCNQKEANAAIDAGRAAIAKATGGAS